MTEADVLTLLRAALRTASLMAAPILIAALLAGLAIGLMQALTSIQELTLTFVPKLLVIIIVFWLTAGFMAVSLLGFFETKVLPLFFS
ncbi:flagellar biosynthetic protein FliQ [Parvularcula lutaonensis]|uniref:Flagellar biosynthetic protein FliQ n=1 Tax=Parvularcula lutaonensis TaxID=491923 RepID=A0ABV7M870_9PROT|nr:flagellar biosynthetic protein FliQ [Parvularcula lutaonensis]GGY43851.1 flagellar biosynthetic protein FliQ [Parvularcula lutaonensis]